MTVHHVTIRLVLAGPKRTPWKWVGTCTCRWRCLSWQWDRGDGTGTLPMSLDHLRENAPRDWDGGA